jgi:hypothetical protein
MVMTGLSRWSETSRPHLVGSHGVRHCVSLCMQYAAHTSMSIPVYSQAPGPFTNLSLERHRPQTARPATGKEDKVATPSALTRPFAEEKGMWYGEGGVGRRDMSP